MQTERLKRITRVRGERVAKQCTKECLERASEYGKRKDVVAKVSQLQSELLQQSTTTGVEIGGDTELWVGKGDIEVRKDEEVDFRCPASSLYGVRLHMDGGMELEVVCRIGKEDVCWRCGSGKGVIQGVLLLLAIRGAICAGAWRSRTPHHIHTTLTSSASWNTARRAAEILVASTLCHPTPSHIFALQKWANDTLPSNHLQLLTGFRLITPHLTTTTSRPRRTRWTAKGSGIGGEGGGGGGGSRSDMEGEK